MHNIAKGNSSYFSRTRNVTWGVEESTHHQTHTIKMKEAKDYFTLKDHQKYNTFNFIRNLLNTPLFTDYLLYLSLEVNKIIFLNFECRF